MKKIYFLFITFFIINITYAQFHGDNFDGFWPGIGYGDFVFEYDTTHLNNVWQIGEPQKTIFSQAYSLPNALITDTLNFYPINDTSIITIKVPVFSHDWGAHTISFYYKLNTDSLNDYGMLEVSADGGNTYINVLTEWSNYGFWWNGNIVENYTGNTNGWESFSICISGILNYYPSADTILYKFSFISDSIQTNKDGWMIDDLVVQDVTENINVYQQNNHNICLPNPTTGKITLRAEGIKKAEVMNMQGRIVLSQKTNLSADRHEDKNQKYEFDLSNQTKGIYIIKITTDKGIAVGKVVLE